MDTQTNASTAPGPGGGPYPEPPQGIRRLYRRPDRGLVAGVAAGLGEYFDLDPLLFRIAFLVTAFLGGVGILAYGLGWWIIPPAPVPPGTTPRRRVVRGERLRNRLQASPAWLGVALLILGFALLASHTPFWHPGLVWGVALIALGVLVFRQRGTRAPVEEFQAAAPPVAEPSAAVPALPAASPPRAVAMRRRERSALGWLTVGAILLAVGLAILLDAGRAIHLRPVQFVALPLAVLGLGVLAGAWWGRARWLIPFGILLVPFVLAASLIHVPFTGGFGEQNWRPRSVAAVRPVYRQVGGQLVLDLREVPLAGQVVSIRATSVAGHLLVYVPRGSTVIVDARAGAGELYLFGERTDGFSLEWNRTVRAPRGAGTVHLDLETSFGQVEVRR